MGGVCPNNIGAGKSALAKHPVPFPPSPFQSHVATLQTLQEFVWLPTGPFRSHVTMSQKSCTVPITWPIGHTWSHAPQGVSMECHWGTLQIVDWGQRLGREISSLGQNRGSKIVKFGKKEKDSAGTSTMEHPCPSLSVYLAHIPLVKVGGVGDTWGHLNPNPNNPKIWSPQ